MKLLDLLMIFEKGISVEKKYEILEAYSFTSKLRIDKRSFVKDRRLRFAIYRKLQRASANARVR